MPFKYGYIGENLGYFFPGILVYHCPPPPSLTDPDKMHIIVHFLIILEEGCCGQPKYRNVGLCFHNKFPCFDTTYMYTRGIVIHGCLLKSSLSQIINTQGDYPTECTEQALFFGCCRFQVSGETSAKHEALDRLKNAQK